MIDEVGMNLGKPQEPEKSSKNVDSSVYSYYSSVDSDILK